MQVSLLADTQNATMDNASSIERFDITPTTPDEFIKLQIQKT
jgi:phage tail sheath protein FI